MSRTILWTVLAALTIFCVTAGVYYVIGRDLGTAAVAGIAWAIGWTLGVIIYRRWSDN